MECIIEKQYLKYHFRQLPFGNGYAVFAGLEKVIQYLKNLHFTESDISYLRNELGYEEEFLTFLKDLRFTGSVRSMVEGEIVFGYEPF